MSLKERIEQKLDAHFKPEFINVINESDGHRVPPNSETHFKVVIASELFQDQRLIQRHRSVNQILSDELSGTVHALALHTYTPQEWQDRQHAPSSPKCAGL